MNNLKIFNNEELGFKVRVIDNEDGSISINAEDTAIGYGWYKTEVKNGKEYISIRWERMNGFSTECGFAHKWSKDDYIPESLFYRLGMKASNTHANRFQDWLSFEVIPSIRKNGGYIMGQEKLSDEELIAQALLVAKKKIEEKNKKIDGLETEVKVKNQIIGELKSKADYTDLILNNKALVNITQIAKDYGMSGQEMNKLLHKFGVQYKQGDQWLLYVKYHNKGYTHSETINFNHKNGNPDVKMNTKWTQKGRLFLYELLKEKGYLPVIEQESTLFLYSSSKNEEAYK